MLWRKIFANPIVLYSEPFENAPPSLIQGNRMKKALVFNVWVLISAIPRLKLLE
ncbi:MAG TPA: hypothetical protein PK299_10105 [Anaerolineales bacterium]|nr:hypothetical protein [Anaerolineales bacterium]